MEELKNLVYSRELRWNEAIAIGLRLFFYNIRTVILGMIVIALPISLLLNLIQVRMVNANEILQQLSAAATVTENQLYAVMQEVMTTSLLLMAVTVFLEPIFVIGVAKATKWRLESRQANYGAVFRQAMLLEPIVVKVGIVYMALFFLGSFLVIPAIYLDVVWCFYLYCIALGKRRGIDALGHSRILVRGRWWRTFGFLIALGIFSFGWNGILQMLFTLFPSNFVTGTIYTCATYLTQGLIVSSMTVLYLNRESALFGMDALQEEDAEAEDPVAR